MKKNMFHKVLAAVLVGVMAMSILAGCGKDEGGSSGSGGSNPANSNGVAGIAGFTAFDKKVTLRVPVYQRATPNGAPNAADNYWTKWVQTEFGDKYNIDVQYVALERGRENELYAQLASTKKLPVCCFEYDYPDVTLYQSEGYFAEYDIEWFKQIAPTYWAAMEAEGLDKYTKINGQNVLLIGTRPYGKTNYQFVTFYRKDWMEAAGYTEYPGDPDEQLKMYKKIYDLKLCGDHILSGRKVGNQAGADQNYAYRKYPQDRELWATTGDYSIPALSTDAQKELLRFQNQLYNLGYIDDEYNTRGDEDVNADFINGKSFTYICYSTNNVEVLNKFYAANPNAKLGIIVNNGPETYANGSCNAFRPNGIFGEYIGFSSQATEDEKKAFAMYLEWMSQDDVLFTLQWGFEGKNFNYENGTPVSVADQSGIAEQQSHNNNVDMWCLVVATRSLGDVDKDIQAITPMGYPDSDQFFKDIKANYEGQLKCYEAGLASPDCMFTVSIKAADEYKDTLLTTYETLRDRIVMGSVADFEKNYEAASKQYLEAGYQKIIDERKAAYQAGNYN